MRKALIIANPGEKGGQGYCEGVNKDVESYTSFLTSAFGGLWSPDEINVLRQPSVSTLKSAVTSLSSADYSISVFCGHAYSRQSGATVLELSKGVEIDADEIKKGAPRHVTILDCCRVVMPTLRAFVEAATLAKIAPPTIYPSLCRKYYDEYALKCPPGLVVLNSCRRGETAGDDSSLGGIYSHALVSAAKDWTKTFRSAPNPYSVFSFVQAHDVASEKVKRASGDRQHPEVIKPRAEPYFPFGIVA